MPYCFAEHLYPGVPLLALHEMKKHEEFQVGDVSIMPFEVMHGKLPIMAFRFGPLAYITDMKTISPEDMAYLEGVDTLVVNALRREKEHHSHQLLGDAISLAQKVGARRTYIIHITHKMGLHSDVAEILPDGIELAYDGLKITV